MTPSKKRKKSVAIGQDYFQQQLLKQQQQQQPASAAAAQSQRRRKQLASTARRAPRVQAVPHEDDGSNSTYRTTDSSKPPPGARAAAAAAEEEETSPTVSSRASKRRKVDRSSPPQHHATAPAAAAAAALAHTGTTTTTAAAAPKTKPSSRPSLQRGQDYYQKQVRKQEWSPPAVRTVEATTNVAVPTATSVVAAARPQLHSLPPPPDHDPRLRRRIHNTGPRLEWIPQESQEEIVRTSEDKEEMEEEEMEDAPFLDAIPEPSPIHAAVRRTSTTPRRRSFVRGKLLLVVAPVAVAFAALLFSPHWLTGCQQSWHEFWSSMGSIRSISSSSPSIHDGPPCFQDYPTATEDDESAQEEENLPPHCLDPQSRTACPPHAICRRGVMAGCLNYHHWQINGTACVLTPQAQDTVRATHALLEKYTVHVFCGRHYSKIKHPLFAQYDDQYSGVPLFRYRPLAETYLQTTYDPDLLELANEEELTFVLRRANSSTSDKGGDIQLVGLHPRHALDIPLRCTLQNYFRMVTQLVGAVLLGVLGILGSYLWDSLVTAPLQTVVLVGGGSLLLWWIFGIRRRNRAKRQRDLDIVNLRHAALLRLEQQHYHAVAAPHLCDALLWDLFPTNQAQRQRWKHQLWPCVVQDLRTDSRVECTYQGSELVLQWQSSIVSDSNNNKQRVQFG